MWVMTTQGFYSVVAHRDEPDSVIVRARTSEDIEALREQGHCMPERLPRGMDPRENALLAAPDDTTPRGRWYLKLRPTSRTPLASKAEATVSPSKPTH